MMKFPLKGPVARDRHNAVLACHGAGYLKNGRAIRANISDPHLVHQQILQEMHFFDMILIK
jgi:hypothetical protein